MKIETEKDFELIQAFGPPVLRTKIPEEIVNKLNNYIDDIISNDTKSDKLDHGKNLVGDVTQEFKLEQSFISESGWLKFLGQSVQKWFKLSIQRDIKEFKLIDSWVVRQFKNEYNPIHFHDGDISGVGYLKIPKNLTKNKKKTKTNGTIDFISGQKSFLSNSIHNHVPKVGDMIIFPNYLMHTAYPFSVEGERRSFSFNLEVDKKISKTI